MKKVVCICIFFAIGISAFTLGYREKIEEEEKQIESYILSNSNVASVQIKRNIESSNWTAVIFLTNGGLINITKCNWEVIKNGWMIFNQFGDYQVWACCRIKGRNPEIESDNYAWRAISVAFSEILHKPFNNIDDFINNYDAIIEMLQKLAEESKNERIERHDMVYTDSDFLNYYGNYETDDLWGYVFARPYNEYLEGQVYWFYNP